MAGFGGFKVISVDYRMPPDHPYPAGLDDAMTVWKAATKMSPPKNMAIFGSSAGGNLTLAMVLRAKQDKLPLPAAIAPGTPMSDLTGAGDSFQTNAMLDNVLVAYGATATSAPRSMPTAAISGTRCSRLSMATYAVFRRRFSPPGRAICSSPTPCACTASSARPGSKHCCRSSKVNRHAQYYRDVGAPETKEAFTEIARFFDSTSEDSTRAARTRA